MISDDLYRLDESEYYLIEYIGAVVAEGWMNRLPHSKSTNFISKDRNKAFYFTAQEVAMMYKNLAGMPDILTRLKAVPVDREFIDELVGI